MNADRAYESEPMLDKEEAFQHLKQRQSFLQRYQRLILLQVLLITLYTTFFVVLWYMISRDPLARLSPLLDAKVQWQAKPYTDFEESIYAGLPTPKLDGAWHDMLDKITLRVTKEELHVNNQTSVPLPNGGYMAWLGVSHELHCIKMLRQWNYREHYHPDITDLDAEHWLVHADHCLDVLRSAALCHGDTSLTTFRWDVKEKPMLNTKLVPHKCVDWQSLTSSVEHRVVSREEVGSMVNPLLHPR